MGNKSTFVASLLSGLVCITVACSPTPPQRLWVRAGRLIDGTNAVTQNAMRIEIDTGAITAVRIDDGAAPPPGTAVLDARDLTVLPGLVDAHVHLFMSPACHPGRDVGLRQAVRNLHAHLRAGVTTVADLAAPWRAAVGLRHYVGTARQRGPRLLVAGPMLTAVNGYPVGIEDTLGMRKAGAVMEVSDGLAARAAVRELADRGVDLIKVAEQNTFYDGRPLPVLDNATLCAAIDEAHRQHLRAFVHTTEAAGATQAVQCGVDVLAHGLSDPLPDALVTAMERAGTVMLPTHRVFEALAETAATLRSRLETPAAARAVAEASRLDLQHYADALAEQETSGKRTLLPDFFGALVPREPLVHGGAVRLQNSLRVRRAKVTLGLGTDSAFCANWAGEPVEELQRFVDAGFTPLRALHAASAGSARALGLHEAVGVLQKGYRADFIAVAGMPDQDIQALKQVRHVFIEGVEQSLDDPPWYRALLLFVDIALTRLRGH